MRFERAERRRSVQGFTLIEVMISIGIMTLGAMAILALQQHVIRSNAHARQLSTASQIAQRWIERLKQDAFSWNQEGTFPGPPNDAVVLAGTTFLRQVATAPNVFQTLTVPAVMQPVLNQIGGISNSFDFQGNDVLPNSTKPDVFYCASFRPSWVYYGQALRVDVRVWWAVDAHAAVQGSNKVQHVVSGNTGDFPGCVDDNARLNPGPNGTLINDYHVVYLSTVIRFTPVYN